MSRRTAGGFVLLALLLAAVNLRAHLASLPPVVDDVAASLGLTSAGVGLLTSVPVLCFALFTPAASALTARVGPERAITLGLLGILGGTLLRSTGSVTTAMVGTTVLGVGITIGNVAVPVVIARDFRERAASVTGAYAATMNAGSTVTTLLTVPLAVAYGWQWALAGWGVLAVVALAFWVPAGGGRAAAPPPGAPPPPPPPAPPPGAASPRTIARTTPPPTPLGQPGRPRRTPGTTGARTPPSAASSSCSPSRSPGRRPATTR
jgi:CP family cyanate transporter-like MFS transporter